MTGSRDNFEFKLKFDGIPIITAKMKSFKGIEDLIKELKRKFK